MKSALNLSSIFRGIGARDPRQTFDLVEVLQPGITVGDYSKLGPLVIPPTSVFGGQVLGVAVRRSIHVLTAPPNGCNVYWSAAVGVQNGSARAANEFWRFRISAAATTIANAVTFINMLAGHQASAAVVQAGDSLAPANATLSPGTASGNGVAYHHFIPGGSVFELWTDRDNLSLFSEFMVEDIPVQPLPDASLAATP